MPRLPDFYVTSAPSDERKSHQMATCNGSQCSTRLQNNGKELHTFSNNWNCTKLSSKNTTCARLCFCSVKHIKTSMKSFPQRCTSGGSAPKCKLIRLKRFCQRTGLQVKDSAVEFSQPSQVARVTTHFGKKNI